MSEHGDQVHDELPDPVEDFAVRVEQQDEGWAVIKTAAGESSVIDHHPDQASAQQQADLLHDAATRNEGAHREEPVPDTYPGKGVDETKNSPLQTPGA